MNPVLVNSLVLGFLVSAQIGVGCVHLYDRYHVSKLLGEATAAAQKASSSYDLALASRQSFPPKADPSAGSGSPHTIVAAKTAEQVLSCAKSCGAQIISLRSVSTTPPDLAFDLTLRCRDTKTFLRFVEEVERNLGARVLSDALEFFAEPRDVRMRVRCSHNENANRDK